MQACLKPPEIQEAIATLIPADERKTLLENGQRTANGQEIDPFPVVKLFTPDAGGTWLLTEVDPDDPCRAFGLCDLGMQCPELGYVDLRELVTVRGNYGLPVERDRFFKATKPLSAYAEIARRKGYIAT